MRSGTGHCISGVQHNYYVVHDVVEMLLPASQADGVQNRREASSLSILCVNTIGNAITVVDNHWTGLVDWTSGLYWWTYLCSPAGHWYIHLLPLTN